MMFIKYMTLVGILCLSIKSLAQEHGPLHDTTGPVQPNFEIYNKEKLEVKILSLKFYGAQKVKCTTTRNHPRVAPKGNFQAQIEWKEKSDPLIFLKIQAAEKEYAYTIFPKGEKAVKDVYVSFNVQSATQKEGLYGETGPLKGWMGKTKSGLLLKNNLGNEMIKSGDQRSEKFKNSDNDFMSGGFINCW